MGQSEIVVLMGVSGCGKSTVGKSLSNVTGFAFLDADDFHPRTNIEKMKRGLPLTDEDRRPWLDAIVGVLDKKSKSGQNIVLACSALKQSYREILSSGRVSPKFVFLEGDPVLIGARLRAREGHFMTANLLDSQVQTLEIPEDSIRVSIDQPVSVIVEQICAELWPETL